MLDATSLKNSQEPIFYWDTDGHAVILGALLTLAAFGAVFGGLSYFDVAPLQYDFQWIGWGVCAAAAIYPICVGVSVLVNQYCNPVVDQPKADEGAKQQPVKEAEPQANSTDLVVPSGLPNLGEIQGYDLIGLILNYLPAGSIPLCSQVSKAWRYLCATNFSLKQKKNLALDSLKTIKAVIAQTDQDGARKLVAREMSKVVAEFDVEHAKEIASSLDNNFLGNARDQALLKIVEVEAANDIQKAKRTANSIEETVDVIKALTSIVKKEVFVDRMEAQKTLQTAKAKLLLLQNNRERLISLLAIAEADMLIDTEQAKITLQKAKKIPNLKDKDYLQILERDLKIDENQARKTLQLIEDPGVRSQAYKKIGKAEAERGDFEKAKQTLKQGKDEALLDSSTDSQVHNLGSLAKTQFKIGDHEEAKATIQQAKTISSSITDDDARAIALAQIAHVESFFDVEQAKKTIQSAKALLKANIHFIMGPVIMHNTNPPIILGYEAKFDLENAKKESLSLPEGNFKNRSSALNGIVKEEQKVDPAKAKQTAGLISDPLYKVDALLGLIK